jgi:hypothetical protein
MEDRGVALVPGPATTAFCRCASPAPHVRALRKGAARTYCSACSLPIRLDFVLGRR